MRSVVGFLEEGKRRLEEERTRGRTRLVSRWCRRREKELKADLLLFVGRSYDATRPSHLIQLRSLHLLLRQMSSDQPLGDEQTVDGLVLLLLLLKEQDGDGVRWKEWIRPWKFEAGSEGYHVVSVLGEVEGGRVQRRGERRVSFGEAPVAAVAKVLKGGYFRGLRPQKMAGLLGEG